jgi:hypothetical protein
MFPQKSKPDRPVPIQPELPQFSILIVIYGLLIFVAVVTMLVNPPLSSGGFSFPFVGIFLESTLR